MVRLDKFLCDCGKGSRSQVKSLVRAGLVTVNWDVAKDPERKVGAGDQVCLNNEVCRYRPFAYFMLHKPADVVSATVDNTADTVLSLLKGVTDKGLFPVGRLDIDTTGLLLITNDGELGHRLTSPKRHVDKAYLVKIRSPLSDQDLRLLEEGVDIGDEKPTLPAKVEVLEPDRILLTLHEGRFHQVKRMLFSVGNEVLELKRICVGPLRLDESLAPGQFRELTEEELQALKGAVGLM